MNDTGIIKRNFSRSAVHYDEYCRVQNMVGGELVSRIDGSDYGRILDIGCGTGNYTVRLRRRFATAMITAVDISGSMIKAAKNKAGSEKIEFIEADAEFAEFEYGYDLVTSNACFQWFTGLDAAMGKYNDLLAENGVVVFSMFGPETFCELKGAIAELLGAKVELSSQKFILKAELVGLLEKYFDGVSVEEKSIVEEYDSLRRLLKVIKYTGARGYGFDGLELNRKRLKQMEDIYIKGFGKIAATYQVFYCKAEKRN